MDKSGSLLLAEYHAGWLPLYGLIKFDKKEVMSKENEHIISQNSRRRFFQKRRFL